MVVLHRTLPLFVCTALAPNCLFVCVALAAWMARRAGAAAAEALLWAAALLFGRGAASFYGADARTYALAALCSELLQLCVCAAALCGANRTPEVRALELRSR